MTKDRRRNSRPSKGIDSFSGSLSLNAGTLAIDSSTALGTGTFTIAGGTTIDNLGTGLVTNSNNNAQVWNGNFTFTGTQALNLGTGSVTLGASTTVTVNANTLFVGGVITGSGAGLTKAFRIRHADTFRREYTSTVASRSTMAYSASPPRPPWAAQAAGEGNTGDAVDLDRRRQHLLYTGGAGTLSQAVTA